MPRKFQPVYERHRRYLKALFRAIQEGKPYLYHGVDYKKLESLKRSGLVVKNPTQNHLYTPTVKAKKMLALKEDTFKTPAMTVVPQTERKLPIDSKIPTLRNIADRMAGRFGETAPLVRELVQPCAEEAERMLFELKEAIYTFDPHEDETLVKSTGYRPSTTEAVRYYCPRCRCQKIRQGHKFCPECGRKIKWI